MKYRADTKQWLRLNSTCGVGLPVERGRTIWHLAAAAGAIRVFEHVLAQQPSVVIEAAEQARNLESGWTPLHCALHHGQVDPQPGWY